MCDAETTNISLGGSEVEFFTVSPYVLLLSPAVLDSMADELGPLRARRCADLERTLREFINKSAYGRIGMVEISDFRPGVYRLDVSHVAKVDDTPPGSFGADGGAFVAVDGSRISLLARRLDWETYNELLSGPLDDNSVARRVVESMGGPCFAIVTADADLGLEFDGDGRYILRPGGIQYSAAGISSPGR